MGGRDPDTPAPTSRLPRLQVRPLEAKRLLRRPGAGPGSGQNLRHTAGPPARGLQPATALTPRVGTRPGPSSALGTVSSVSFGGPHRTPQSPPQRGGACAHLTSGSGWGSRRRPVCPRGVGSGWVGGGPGGVVFERERGAGGLLRFASGVPEFENPASTFGSHAAAWGAVPR